MSPEATTGAAHWAVSAAGGSLLKPTMVLIFLRASKSLASLDLQQTYPQHHKEAGKCHLVLQVKS